MPKSVLDESGFRNEPAAYAYVESIVWEKGRFCPHCGVVDRSGPLKGKSTRIGTYKCYVCRKPFTVKVGTIFEKSHVPMHIWLQAMHLICSNKRASPQISSAAFSASISKPGGSSAIASAKP